MFGLLGLYLVLDIVILLKQLKFEMFCTPKRGFNHQIFGNSKNRPDREPECLAITRPDREPECLAISRPDREPECLAITEKMGRQKGEVILLLNKESWRAVYLPNCFHYHN